MSERADKERRFARALTSKLPGTVRVGLYQFSIELWSPDKAAGNGLFGECSSSEQRIGIQRDLATRYNVVDTFIHEINHAIFWVYGVRDEDDEERTVGLMSSGWSALYRDNPWLMDWIKSAKL